MANSTVDDLYAPSAGSGHPSNDTLGDLLRTVLRPLASLRLTVALFASAILLIFFGTLAQVEKESWEVMGLYFRCPVAWVPVEIMFPKVFFPTLPPIPGLGWMVSNNFSFPFPGGFVIGGAMLANLLAAHGVRFTIQARGSRLVAGVAMTAIGVALGWLVVMGGSDKDVVESRNAVNAVGIWWCVKAALGGLWLTILYGLWKADPAHRLERWGLGTLGVLIGGVLGLLLYYGSAATPDPSGMRILLQLGKATGVGLVLLAGCVLVFRKRAGIVLLHAGVGLMIANELVVYALHSEAMMQIIEGHTAHYAEDIRTIELAVVDPADKNEDEVSVIPKGLLVDPESADKPIKSEFLPFNVEVLKYYANSALRAAGPHEPNLATAGAGLKMIAEPQRAANGVENDKAVDSPTAYVKLIDKQSGKPLGTYLTNRDLRPQTVEVDGKKYELALRFKRDYKPYAVKLIDVRKDDYVGTSTPRDYRSEIKLTDAKNNVDRQYSIWMNNPLRYAGETFYQSSYHPGTGDGEVTTLQIVKNTGWMIPYLGCMIVAVGMLFQFGQTLLRFLRRREGLSTADVSIKLLFQAMLGPFLGRFGHGLWKQGQVRAAAERESREQKRNRKRRPQPFTPPPGPTTGDVVAAVLPFVVVLVFGGWLATKAIEPKAKPDQFHLYEFGKLPILYQGRCKPVDTLARNSLQILSGKQEFVDADGKTQPAVRWLLDVLSHTKAQDDEKVFRIDNPEVLGTLQLKDRKSHLYSIDEITPRFDEFRKQAEAIHDRDPHDLTTYQKKLLELGKKLEHYMLLIQSFEPPHLREGKELEDLLATREIERHLKKKQAPLAVPPGPHDKSWEPFAVAWAKAYAAVHVFNQEANPATVSWAAILSAWRQDNVNDFDAAVAKYRSEIVSRPPAEVNPDKVDLEVFFNNFSPFYWASGLDIVALVLTCLAWIGWNRALNRTALWLLILTFAVHTIGIGMRIYISGRPPVTNLYSSALFIGWACMLLGIVFETIYGMGIGNLVASVAGFGTLQIAHYLSNDGDTMIVMQAVLDTQFWLATHVVCVTMGYAATLVAGLLGTCYVGGATLSPAFDRETSKTLTRMIYGTVCFAMFLSFFGTVLGGLWADDSWGRFWGWDPKENGALIIVIWNALVLHARWGGMVKDRGLAVLAMVGNIVTAWSWFGVNELGKGLHSYGFTEGVALALGIGILTQLAIIALGTTPKRLWPFFGARRPQA